LRSSSGADLSYSYPLKDILEMGEDLLKPIIERHRQDRCFYVLDSAGGIGWFEFRYVWRLHGSFPCGVLLDDINHVKHNRSWKYISTSQAFNIIDFNTAEGWGIALANWS